MNFSKLPYQVILYLLREFYELEINSSLIELYGYFKKDKTRKIFKLYGSFVLKCPYNFREKDFIPLIDKKTNSLRILTSDLISFKIMDTYNGLFSNGNGLENLQIKTRVVYKYNLFGASSTRVNSFLNRYDDYFVYVLVSRLINPDILFRSNLKYLVLTVSTYTKIKPLIKFVPYSLRSIKLIIENYYWSESFTDNYLIEILRILTLKPKLKVIVFEFSSEYEEKKHVSLNCSIPIKYIINKEI